MKRIKRHKTHLPPPVAAQITATIAILRSQRRQPPPHRERSLSIRTPQTSSAPTFSHFFVFISRRSARRCRLAMTTKPSSDRILPPLDGSYRLARPGGDMSRGRKGAMVDRRRGHGGAQRRVAIARREVLHGRRKRLKTERQLIEN